MSDPLVPYRPLPRYVIHAADLLDLPFVYGAARIFMEPLLVGAPESFPLPPGWNDTAGLVVLNGESFVGAKASQERQQATLAMFFQNYHRKFRRWPRVYRVGPRGGLQPVDPQAIGANPKYA